MLSSWTISWSSSSVVEATSRPSHIPSISGPPGHPGSVLEPREGLAQWYWTERVRPLISRVCITLLLLGRRAGGGPGPGVEGNYFLPALARAFALGFGSAALAGASWWVGTIVLTLACPTIFSSRTVTWCPAA